MTRLLAALLLCSGVFAAAPASAARPGSGASSYESKVASKLRKDGYRVTANQVTIRGMGLRLPGKPNSGKTKIWSVNTREAVLSGRILFDSLGRARVTVSNTTKHALKR